MVKEEKKKQKLTLAIDKEVINRAKSSGINISNLTEEILTAVTSDISDYDQDNLVLMYENFFSALEPYLRKYGITVVVGRKHNDDRLGLSVPISLSHNGLRYPTDSDGTLSPMLVMATTLYRDRTTWVKPTVADILSMLDEPTEILEKFLKELIDAAQKNKEKIQQFKFALGLIKALDEGDKQTIAKK